SQKLITVGLTYFPNSRPSEITRVLLSKQVSNPAQDKDVAAKSRGKVHIRGRVVGTNSKPVAEPELTVLSAVTNKRLPGSRISADGRYDVQLDHPGEYFFVFEAPGYREGSFLIRVRPDFSTDFYQDEGQITSPDEVVLYTEGEAVKRIGALASKPEDIPIDRSFTINSPEVEGLPLSSSRSFDALALLAPGVLPPPASLGTVGPGVAPGVGTPGQFSVNGLRSRENNFLVDGADNNDEDTGTRRQGFVF